MQAIDGDGIDLTIDEFTELVNRRDLVHREGCQTLVPLQMKIGDEKAARKAALQRQARPNARFFQEMRGDFRNDPPQSRAVEPNQTDDKKRQNAPTPKLPASWGTRSRIDSEYFRF